ncbi:diguanylate cyclase [Agaribacterium sp. ZY112]|uniref:diguanylate cyclase n=1 Tax=Agaribacterium sp. ZY112 TaxID=3233574 RepID=UPI003524CF10
MNLKTLLFLSFFAVSSSYAQDCDINVSHQKLESQKDFLIFSLLRLSLSKVVKQVCYHELVEPLTDSRKTQDVSSGLLSLKWASAGPVVEEQLQAIRIPIFKGLLGYRLLVVRAGDSIRFATVNNVEGLRQFRAGVGERWGDRPVLEASELPLILSTRGRYLWNMLIRGRFDYLPLGLHEPWQDIPRFGKQLEVEPSLILVYPMALYFYVSKDNEELHALLNQGMELAIKDGSYDQLLYRSAIMREAAAKARVGKRRLIRLHNPYLPVDTPLGRSEFWLDPASFESAVTEANAVIAPPS